MKKMLTMMAIAMLAGPALAAAATVTNLDDTAHTLIVTDGSDQVQVEIGPGETIEICLSGCFVTMPNGDRVVLTGSDTLEIEGGGGRVF